jgi:outer membrane protein TolC
VRSRLRHALLALYGARQTASLEARQELALRRVASLLEGQFRAGAVSSYTVTQARIVLEHAILARQAQAGRIRQARIALAGSIGVPVSALRGVHLSFAGFRRFPRDLTRPVVRQQALLGRSDVRAALAQYAASQSALKLEIARQWPDIALGPGYAWNAQLVGDQRWQLGLSLTMPVLNQNQGPIAQAKARRRVAAAQFLSVQAAAITQIDGALAAYRSALAQVRTADTLLGNLTHQLNAIRAEVRAGELQPLDLANAEVAFVDGAQNQLATRLAAQQALGALQNAVQSPLTLRPSVLHSAQNIPHPKGP